MRAREGSRGKKAWAVSALVPGESAKSATKGEERKQGRRERKKARRRRRTEQELDPDEGFERLEISAPGARVGEL